MNTEYFTYETICPDCGERLVITQPKDHSEYTPSGQCEKCKGIFAMTGYLKLDTKLEKISNV